MKFKFKAVYDSACVSEPVIEEFEAADIQEADLHAWRRSGGLGYIEGDYELYIELGGNWIDTDHVVDAMGIKEETA